MDIEKLQKELIEKILLIPVEADSENVGKKALKIVDKLRDHINDIITVGNRKFTALDCVIIADSRDDNPRLSERPRINNGTLKELENAIRDVGGKTSEELQAMGDANFQMIRKAICALFTLTLSASSLYLMYQSRNDQGLSMSRLMAIGTGATAILMHLGELAYEERVSTDLKHATVQHEIERRQLSIP